MSTDEYRQAFEKFCTDLQTLSKDIQFYEEKQIIIKKLSELNLTAIDIKVKDWEKYSHRSLPTPQYPLRRLKPWSCGRRASLS